MRRSDTDKRFQCMRLLAVFGILFAITALAARAGEVVRVENASRPTRCAEEDNVYVKFVGAGITGLTIEARHPAYLAELRDDMREPDFADCEMGHDDPSYPSEPRDLVLYDGPDYALVGRTTESFWRQGIVDFKVGGVTAHALHKVQLFRKIAGQRIMILEVYPPDGYWRVKPLPPPGFAENQFGSSFLVGPIVEGRRPFVALTAIEFVPSELAFHLAFKGGMGVLRVTEASPERTRLEVTLPAAAGTTPFAAIRSMFVTPDKADTALTVLSWGSHNPAIHPVMELTSSDAQAVMFERTVPARHNSTAPDLSFGNFSR